MRCRYLDLLPLYGGLPGCLKALLVALCELRCVKWIPLVFMRSLCLHARYQTWGTALGAQAPPFLPTPRSSSRWVLLCALLHAC